MVGYNVQNIKSLNALYICLRCLLLLRDPVQLIDCGHRLCQSCADELIEGDLILCPGCHEKIARNKLVIDRGFKNDTQNLLIECSLCTWIDILKNYPGHLYQIHPNPVCNYCGKKFSSVYDLDRHKQYECEKITVNCPLKIFGCEEMILRINLPKHYQSVEHQNVLINIVHHLKSSSHMITDLSHNIVNTVNQLQEVNEAVVILSSGVEILNDDLQRVKAESTCYENTLKPLEQDLSTLKISIQEQNACFDSTKIDQDLLQQDLASMKQKINDMKTSSHDGTLIWTITEVQEKIADARLERQTSIYSAPFYSSPTGYKMCARLYLNGDGNARGTHVSLFFVLMRGDYDAILKFPFNFKVTFCLYDQTNQQHHIIDSFRPDIKSSSFQRPRSDMNIASGIPKFVPLSKIQHESTPYIRDNIMFIKVMVDFNNTPKAILPYALSLNPALTAPIQQIMIQQEIERRSSTSSMANVQQTSILSNIPTNMDDQPTDPPNDDVDHMTG